MNEMNQPEKESAVTIHLTSDEALVLSDFFQRFSDTDKLSLEHQGEAQALWNLCCLLEKELVEPFTPEYQELLDAARETLKQGINQESTEQSNGG